ncbi:hypothetical protein, conserved [Leishmania tarentolae]|uniref:SPRY domain-containing protein n=1 Tax=Leishmania tarentolae TaxID=5689 RepID=A0A640KPY5_LEITA|nr:hypothetical protein, conserved [Leishmania tarentolae]
MLSSSARSLEDVLTPPTPPPVHTSFFQGAASSMRKGIETPPPNTRVSTTPLSSPDVNTALAATNTPLSSTLKEVLDSLGDVPAVAGSAASKTSDFSNLKSTPSQQWRTPFMQRRLEKDADAEAGLPIVSDQSPTLPHAENVCSRALSMYLTRPQESPNQVYARGTPSVSPRRVINEAAAVLASSEVKSGDEMDSSTPTTFSVGGVSRETSKPATVRPSALETLPSKTRGKGAAAEEATATTPKVTLSSQPCNQSVAPATPRKRHGTFLQTMSVSPLTTASTCTLSSNEDNEEATPAASKRRVRVADTVVTAGSNENETCGTPRALAVPRGTDSGSASATVATLRGRLAAATRLSPACASTGSWKAGASSGSTTDSKSAEATALSELPQLRQALKDKERDIARLTRDVGRATQAAEKAQKKTDELLAKLESEKSAFAAHKKDSLAQRQELQRELRQAQTARRLAEQLQDKSQRELEKQKEKLATAMSRAASSTSTPLLSPRSTVPPSATFDATLQAKLSTLESEKKRMQGTIRHLEEKICAFSTAADLAKNAKEKCDVSTDAATEASETTATLKKEVAYLRQQLSAQDTKVRDQEERVSALLQENKALQERQSSETKPARRDVAVVTQPAAAAPGREVSEEASLIVRSPSRGVDLDTSEKAAMVRLREELTMAQSQVEEYKRINEKAERRMKRLEVQLAALRRRAEAEEAATRMASEAADSPVSRAEQTTIFKDTIAGMREQLANMTAECGELRQRARERSEEATTLQSALQETEDDRDSLVQQIRDLKARASEAEQKAAAALGSQKTELYGALEKARKELQAARAELRVAEESAEGHEEALRALRRQLGDEQLRCADLEREKKAAQEEAAANAAAAGASKKQAEHYKKKTKHLNNKLNEAMQELSVLGEEYERVCAERELAVASDTENNDISGARRLRSGPAGTDCEHPTTTRDREAVNRAVSPFEEKRTTSVSRNLSDALLSANRFAPGTGAPSPAWASASRDLERQTREPLELDVLSLYSKVSAIDHVDQKSWYSVDRGRAGATAGATSANFPLESMHGQPRDPRQSPRMTAIMHEGPGTDGALARARSPGRARSPQPTHALDARYFDPTIFTCPESPPHSSGVDSANGRGHATVPPHQHAKLQQQSRSLPPEALHLSPGVRSRGDAASLYKGLSPHSMALSTSTSALQPYPSDSSVSAVSAFSELPATAVYYFTRGAGNSGREEGLFTPLELQFNSSAGRLLLSKRGRCVQRPVFRAEENEVADLDICCAAIGSVSHTIYASHMLARGHYHLKHIFSFIIRVLSDCESSGGGDVLVGFADRYVPMESFGAKRNALHYKGCYYLSLRNGGLFCPAKGICDATYEGWSAAAAEASRRRCYSGAEARRDRGARATFAQDGEASLTGLQATSAPAPARALPRPEYVARAGDEIACTLCTDEQSIRYSWNGIECGVAFTEVSLSPSLYPCVEVNTSGGTLELLGIHFSA